MEFFMWINMSVYVDQYERAARKGDTNKSEIRR